MLFNSIEFLLFLPIVLLGYSILKPYRASLLLIASYFFYGWWNWNYLGLIILSTVIDYICAKEIDNQLAKTVRKKTFLLISLCSNLGVLAFFKYFNFFANETNKLLSLLGLEYLMPLSGFLLPMGISFYTFQTMSYTIEVYQSKIKAEKNFFTFALYVSFFPQLVAGPIERPNQLIKQLKKLDNLNIHNFKEGFYRLVFGIFKKVVIADRLALFVNQIYDSPENYDGSILLIATFFFAFQIYCDFSGYSDIAIGTARMFGINLMENFKMPYMSKNIKEFWSNWHISLSSWFRDYLYIPLGGNKKLHIRNILIVFIVSGLWHGANWTFIIWGTLHGCYFLIQHFISKHVTIHTKTSFKSLKTVFTFSIVCFAWIFFRAHNIEDALTITSNLFNFNITNIKDIGYQMKQGILEPSSLSSALSLNFGEFHFQSSVGDLLFSFLLIPLLVGLEYFKSLNIIKSKPDLRAFVYFILGIIVILFGVFSQNQFIYFQF